MATLNPRILDWSGQRLRRTYTASRSPLLAGRMNPAWHAAAVLCVLMAPGCATKREEAWTPKPQVPWEQIATEPFETPTNGYRILVPQPTTGLFPADISVGRVALGDADRTDLPTGPHLVRDPRNEFLQWNDAFNDTMAVSAVFPISQRNLDGAEASPELVIAVMRALGARLGLVYAVNEKSETETEMIGALYETDGYRPIALFHARAVSVKPAKKRRYGDPEDPWETDSKALVRHEFETIVRSCVRELIANDQPAEVETPEGWVPAGPILPVVWPPREWPPRIFRYHR